MSNMIIDLLTRFSTDNPPQEAHEALRRSPGETAHTCVFTTDGGSQVLGEAYASANMGTRSGRVFAGEHQARKRA